MSAVSFLYLTQEDMIEAGVLDMHKCIETMDKAFKLQAKGDYVAGGYKGDSHGLIIVWPEKPRGPRMPLPGPHRRFMAMPAYLGGEFHVVGTKWYGSNITNPRERNLPRSMHFVILNDADIGEPIALMDGTLISAMRTGAGAGVCSKYLARKYSDVIGIIGAGVISRVALMAHADVLKNIKGVKVFDLVKSKSEAFSKNMGEELGLNIHPVDSAEEAVKNSDVVNVATAGPKDPWIEFKWLKEGSLLVLSSGIEGSDDVFLKSKIVVSSKKMDEIGRREREEAGFPSRTHEKLITEERIKEDDITELGQIVIGSKPGRVDEREKFVVPGGGASLPIQDVAWGYAVYKEALKKDIGQRLDLWKKPHWF